jgi:NAD(P)-dependent dehydrogenase (short-subunit alcohol dehydrogenase family)
VAITSRNETSALAASKELEALTGGKVSGFALDLTAHQSLEQCHRQIQDGFGDVTILVNNAGGAPAEPRRNFLERPPEAVREMLELNVTGLMEMSRLFAVGMAERGYGKIIHIASVAGLVGRDRRLYARTGLPPQPVDYAAAKGAVIALTRDMAAALAPQGVRVNAISPGGFERRQPQAFIDGYSELTALGHMGQSPFDLAGAAIFLASPASDYVTGENLVVDGGFAWFK